LTSSLRGAKAYVKGGTIFVKDTYGTIKNLDQELLSFGFTVENVSGNMYKFADRTTGLLDILNEGSLQSIVSGSLKIDEALAQVVKNLSGIKLPEIERLKQNATLKTILDSVREGGSYTASDQVVRQGQEYAHDYENFVKRAGTEHTVSRDANIREGREAFSELNQVITNVNGMHKPTMVNGIEVLIKNRAKAMGFTVKQQDTGGQVRLTLEKEN